EPEASDEERELTNLSWLIGNQSLSWTKTIESTENDPFCIIETARKNEKTKIWNSCKIIHDEVKMLCTKENIFTKKTKMFKSTSVSDAKIAKTSTSRWLSPDERYEIFLNKIKCDLAEYEKQASKYESDVAEKPPFNYSHIIGMAMLKKGRVTLQQLCAWIESKFAYFRVRKRWNNSIRHNLSLHHCFRNLKREDKGKGGYWELGIDPKKSDKKRIRKRKLCNHKLNNSLDSKTGCFPKDGFEIKHKEFTKNHGTCVGEYSESVSKPFVLAEQSLVLIDSIPSLTLTKVGLGETPINQNPLLNKGRLEINSLNVLSKKQISQKDYKLGSVLLGSAKILDARQSLNNLSYHDSDSNQLISTPEFPLTCVGTSYDDIAPVLSSSSIINRYGNIQAEISSSGNETINYNSANFDEFDERFHCLHSSIQYNRGDDILDNFLDVCVAHY
ncbi:hypothetical protein KR074_007861, partial [Drosophila pseudoananassae]